MKTIILISLIALLGNKCEIDETSFLAVNKAKDEC